MFNNTRIFLSLIFLITCSSLSAQEQIERLFRGDRQNTGIDVAQTSDQGYLIFSAGRPLDSTRFEYYTVSKFDNKGNTVWNKDYSFEHKVFPDGTITLLEGDSFVISGVLDTTSTNKLLLKGDPNGNVVWTKGYGRKDMDVPLFLGDASVDTSYQKGFYLAGDVYNPANLRDIYLTEIDTFGNQLWGKYYSNPTGIFSTAKVRMAQDSGAIICGTTLEGINPNMFLVKTDRFGNIEWSRNYGEATLAELGTSVAPTPDGGYLLGGRKINPALPNHSAILVKTDTFGVSQWALNVNFGTSDTILVNDIIIASDGNAVVSGSLLGIGTEDTFAWMMKISMNGDVIWKRRYKAATRQFTFSNGLIESPAEGYVYLTSSDEGIGQTQVGPYLIKTDADGQTLCDSIIDSDLVFPETIPVDTLILTQTDTLDSKDVIVVDTANYSFNLVTLSLESFGPYCPDSIFMDTLDATVDGAISYEWSTGETTPMIVVSDFDDYMVTVTIGEDYCYILCNSTSINELPLPTVELDTNDDSFCSTGIVDINATTGATDDIVWSSGEMQMNSIMVNAEGNYIVTVSNTCGTETANIDVVFDTSAPGPVTINEIGNFCDDGISTLEASAPGYDGLLWSPTNESTPEIFANQSGVDYTVTGLSNFCDDLISDPIQVSLPSIDGDIASDGLFCSTGSETLTLTPTREPLNSILWDVNNDMDLTTTVTAAGTYSVTFSDFCDDHTESFTIETPEITGQISSDGLFCATGAETLTLTTNRDPVNGIIWEMNNAETNPTFIAGAIGIYTAAFSDFCDSGTAEYEVQTSQISVRISGDDTFCEDGDESLVAVPENGVPSSYNWSTGETTPSATALAQGTYFLTVSDFCGSASDSLSILCPINFDIPNAFTPNGDNVSDTFIPLFTFDPTELVEYEFIIYSRWGKKVFETTDPTEGWDGMLNEKLALSDAYIYTVKGVNNLGVELTHIDPSKDNHGDLTLIR